METPEDIRAKASLALNKLNEIPDSETRESVALITEIVDRLAGTIVALEATVSSMHARIDVLERHLMGQVSNIQPEAIAEGRCNGSTKQQVTRRLREYIDLIDRINDSDDPSAAYKGLKAKLTVDYGRLSTAEGLTNMVSVEEQYLYPALRDAYTRLSVESDLDPPLPELLDARQDLSWFLQDLEHRNSEAAAQPSAVSMR